MARRGKIEINDAAYEAALAAREEGTTKKRQCEVLGIAYNTSRLDKLLDEYVEDKRVRADLVKKMRSQPVTPQEVANMVEAYLQGDPLGEISRRMYRSTALIKRRLEMAGVWGLRFKETPNPLKPHVVPDECMADSFEVGEKVFVPGYRCLGEVMKEFTDQPDEVNAYRVYLLDADRHRNVIFSAYDLASLKHVEDLGVDLRTLESNMQGDEIKVLLGEALKKARMTARKDA